ncbi:hypothetical protein ACX1DX_08505 [Tessaracoccus sp. Y36]
MAEISLQIPMTQLVISRADLLAKEWTGKNIEAAVSAGTLTRVAHGWYAHPTAESWLIAAVRVGGRLGCLSGCKHHGLWTPSHPKPHIVVGKGVTVGRAGWHRHTAALPGQAVFPVKDCLAQVIRHHSPEEALMVLESAAHKELITRTEAELLIADAPARKQRVLKFFSPLAESGSETRVRLWLQQQRIPVQAQVWIAGVGRVDLLVGRSLVLECDSAEFHEYRDEDYERYLGLRDLGYTPVGLAFNQVHHSWEATKLSLQAELRSGLHLRPPSPR